MPASDGGIYARIVHRITLGILALGGAGTAACAATWGWRFALGFFLGACMSYLSFWRWQTVVESLGTVKQRSVAGMVVRFAVLAAAAYGIVKYLDVTPVAVFLGLLISAAAVIVAILFELIYART